MEADTAAIKTIWEGYTSEVNSGDANHLTSLWDENGIRLAPNGPGAHGTWRIYRECFNCNIQPK